MRTYEDMERSLNEQIDLLINSEPGFDDLDAEDEYGADDYQEMDDYDR